MSHVGPSQRSQLLNAMTEVVALRGYGEASVAAVSARAGLSPRVFDECFTDREACFLAAFDEVVLRASVRVFDACREAESWQEQIKAGLLALLLFFDEQPLVARFAVVESSGVSTRMLWRRSRLLDRFVEVVHGGGWELAGGRPVPSRAVARGVVATVHSVVHESLALGESGGLAALAGPLTSVVVLPYFGEAAACAELGLAGGFVRG